MDNSLDLLAWMRFALAPRLTALQRQKLLSAFETPERVFTTPRAEVARRLGEEIAQALATEPSEDSIKAALDWSAEPDHHFIIRGTPAYPESLLQLPDPPAALYVRGRFELLSAPCFAIVGSRNATAQGMRDAQALAHVLSEAGLTIVSGLALGIDTAAHRGGLQGRGSSLAVMGTGAQTVYPRRNAALGEELAHSGALVTEFPLGTQPIPRNFPCRNRLISGLARGVLVVEASMGSGSLLTARSANEQGRDVFAIPGSIHAPLAKGCHWLIKNGAKLVECAEDILEELKIPQQSASALAAPAIEEPDRFLEAMGHAPISVDEIARRTGKTAAVIAARLTRLQIEGRIAAIAGGLFQRLQGVSEERREARYRMN